MSMSMLNNLLFKLSGHLKIKVIKGELGQPYLERYMLFRWGKNGENSLFLHRFLDSDNDQGVHDHPWDSKSFILCGGYNEERIIEEGGIKVMVIKDIKPLSFNTILKTDFHRIILKNKTPVWTIFFHGPRVKKWGFNRCVIANEGVIDSIEYTPYDDLSNPSEKWEDSAPYGIEVARQDVDYILNK